MKATIILPSNFPLKRLDVLKFEEVGEDLNMGGEVFESMKMFDESVRLMKK